MFLTICFGPPPSPTFVTKNIFFQFFDMGLPRPLLFGQCQQIYCFFFRLPLSRCEWQWQWIFNLPFNPLTWKHRFMEPLGMYTVYLYFTVLLYYIHMLYFFFLYYFFCCFSVRPFCSILELLHHPGSVIYFKIIDGFWHSRCLNDQIHLFYMIESFAKSFIKSGNSDSKYNFEIFKN